MLNEDYRGAVIQSGISFVRSVTEAYGTEEGMALWERMSEVLGPEIKGEIFFAMITGEYQDGIDIKWNVAYSDQSYKQTWRVPMIKAIRTITGFGLKEAKDLNDKLTEQHLHITVPCKPTARGWATQELRKSGFIV